MAAQPVHIDISQEINGWANAQIGRDVRKYNVSALAKLQDQTNTAVDYVVEKGEAIDQAAKDVQTVRQEAQGAVDHANDITAEYKQYADDKLAATESWAVGGTGSRPGEDGSNSQFWAEKSQESAGQASREADRAAQYASIVAPGFLVDPGSMELYMKAGVGVDFIVTDDAELCWKIA